MFSTMDISTSGLVAQRTRLDVIAGNIAMADVTQDAQGSANPYRRRFVVFSPGSDVGDGLGVSVAKVAQDPSSFTLKYEPNHPDAIKSGPKQGYVQYPNVDLTMEYIDAMEAGRAYEANIAAFELSKSMISSSLRLLA